MLTVDVAGTDDIDGLIELECRLFQEDAGTHDPYSDPTWPRREGRRDFEQLMDSPDSVVLVARSSGEPVGLLAGYATLSSPTRRPVRFAVLRTLYVAPSARRSGVATMLTTHFLSWATGQGCVEAHVDHYAANHGAARFYENAGFGERSVSRVLRLPDPIDSPS